MARAALLLLLLAASTAAAEPTTLRIASVAPDGTGWARELHAFARYVEAEAKGTLTIKLYLNGVAGDELEAGTRLERGQLDGVGSGQMLCQKVAPSMRVLRVPGVFQNRDEARHVVTRLQPTIESEAAHNGFVLLGSAGLGPDVLFTRQAVRNLADVRRLRLWRWDVDDVGIAASRQMGMQVVPMRLYDARRGYEEQRLDGFLAAPTAALAFQWSSETRYVTDLHFGYLYGCLVFSQRAFQRLMPQQQAALRAGAARMLVGVEELGRRQDAQLLGELFGKQGLQKLPVSESFRAEFFTAAQAARDRIGESLVPRALLERVLRLLADYRIEHPQR